MFSGGYDVANAPWWVWGLIAIICWQWVYIGHTHWEIYKAGVAAKAQQARIEALQAQIDQMRQEMNVVSELEAPNAPADFVRSRLREYLLEFNGCVQMNFGKPRRSIKFAGDGPQPQLQPAATVKCDLARVHRLMHALVPFIADAMSPWQAEKIAALLKKQSNDDGTAATRECMSLLTSLVHREPITAQDIRPDFKIKKWVNVPLEACTVQFE